MPANIRTCKSLQGLIHATKQCCRVCTFERSSNFVPSANSPVEESDLKWFNPGHLGIPWRLIKWPLLVHITFRGWKFYPSSTSPSARPGRAEMCIRISGSMWSENNPPWYACKRSQDSHICQLHGVPKGRSVCRKIYWIVQRRDNIIRKWVLLWHPAAHMIVTGFRCLSCSTLRPGSRPLASFPLCARYAQRPSLEFLPLGQDRLDKERRHWHCE